MKEIKPTGWLIANDGAWQLTTKSDDLTVAKRFNWKVTPLYSEQSLAEIKAEAVRKVAQDWLITKDHDYTVRKTLLNEADRIEITARFDEIQAQGHKPPID